MGLGSRAELYARFSHRDLLELHVLRRFAPWGDDLFRITIAHQTAIIVNAIRGAAGIRGRGVRVADVLLEFKPDTKRDFSHEEMFAAFCAYAEAHNSKLRLNEGGR